MISESEKLKKNAKRIILDEEKEAEKILNSPTGEIIFRKLLILGKYFYSKGMNKNQVYSRILEYCNRSDVFNIMFFEDMINDIVKKSKLYGLKKSNFKVSITKKEIDVIKLLPHRSYRVALYMLFVSKMEKYQVYKKEKIAKGKSFRTYFNHDLESAMYSSGMETSKKDILDMGIRLFDCGFAKPILGTYKWEILIADFESKDIEFVIDGDVEFEGQIKYYCLKCSLPTKKFKKHELCDDCYKIKRNELSRIIMKKSYKKP